MGSHPINLLFRFILELAALIAFSVWGWKQSDSWFRIVYSVIIPLIFAAIWGVFAVPNDPSRSGSTLIATPGYLRLLIEFAVFALAIWAVYNLAYYNLSYIFGSFVFLHYLFSIDRIKWLLSA